jgi:allantoate deiminase
MPKQSLNQAAATLARRLDRLARVSEERGATTRTFQSPAMRRAGATVGAWMRGAGLSVRVDALGNVIGRTRAPRRGAKTLLMGSHLDTVRDAGRFDGALGVLLPIAALEVLRGRGLALPFAVEVVGFSEEEGVRFSSGYLGSKGYAGRLARADLSLRDRDGISVGEALAPGAGGRFTPPRAAHGPGELIGYLEVHIEQGPVLEDLGLAAGVVSAISGQTRALVAFGGSAGHAGTTPMAMRRDALAGAAEFIVAAEALARARPPLVATVGRVSAHPGAANVIAGGAELSLDVRHPVDAKRRAACRGLREEGRRIAARRRLSFSMEVTQDDDAVQCSRGLTALLAGCVRGREGRCVSLASGAGHDGVVISRLAPIAMLFVRCRGGLSHHPDEFVARRDLGAALRITVDFLARLSARFPP